MDSFEHFADFSMFYFAAASFSETARRVGKAQLADSFLGRTNPAVSRGLEECADILRPDRRGAESAGFEQLVCESVEKINVAGLCVPAKRNWYGVDLEDVIRNSEKLGFSAEGMRDIVRHADWARGPNSALIV